jgi:hypothetical protein
MENGDLHKTIQELSIEVAVLKTRVHGKEEALTIQAREYERRVHELNDAHNLARNVLNTYLPREIFEKEHASLEHKVEEVEREIQTITSSHISAALYTSDKLILADWRRQVDEDRSKQVGGKAMLMGLVALIISISSIAVTLFIRWHS